MSKTTDGLPGEHASSSFPGMQNLEFLVVCEDYPLFKVITGGIHSLKGRLNCAPSVTAAMNYVSRRKMDGIVIDTRLPGAVNLVEGIRGGSSNRFSVIFVCVQGQSDAHQTIRAGANFVLHHPITQEKILQAFTSANSMMTAERRRYFRHPLMVTVHVQVDGVESRATMSNLSESGMAVWCLAQYKPGCTLHFEFDLPFGGRVHGRGEIAWINSEGLMGVRFHILQDSAYTHLSNWLNRRESGALPAS